MSTTPNRSPGFRQALADSLGPETLAGGLPEAEARGLGARAGLAEILAALPDRDAPHLNLEALRTTAADRAAAGPDWTMPEHLAACPLCLELVELLLDPPPPATADALRRFESLGPVRAPKARVGRPRFLIRAAAALFTLAAAGLLAFRLATAPVAVRAGQLVPLSSSVIRLGDAVPRGALLRAAADTRATLADGSCVTLASNTVVSFARAWDGSQTVGVERGQATFEVARQEAGRTFVVQTGLGQIRVVGTRFRVAVGLEDVTVFESGPGAPATRAYADTVATVTVDVDEGRVVVSHARESRTLSPGQTAVLRRNQPGIEVH